MKSKTSTGMRAREEFLSKYERPTDTLEQVERKPLYLRMEEAPEVAHNIMWYDILGEAKDESAN